jgi:hypothetical protein
MVENLSSKAPRIKRKRPRIVSGKLVIGWREWLSLPDLGVDRIKAKIDTGARTSALHAFDVEVFSRDGQKCVRFSIHPTQRDDQECVVTEAPLLEWREVRDSGGNLSQRPVIMTVVEIGPIMWPIEVTLINRDEMGFRMLIGREAIRGHLLVDAGRSFTMGDRRHASQRG